MNVRTLAAFLALVMSTTEAALAGLSPSALSLHAEKYDGTTVTVTGTVQHFEESKSPQVTGYQLCDSRCVIVIDRTNGMHHNGSQATVTGVFHAKWSGPQRSFSNAIIVG